MSRFTRLFLILILWASQARAEETRIEIDYFPPGTAPVQGWIIRRGGEFFISIGGAEYRSSKQVFEQVARIKEKYRPGESVSVPRKSGGVSQGTTPRPGVDHRGEVGVSTVFRDFARVGDVRSQAVYPFEFENYYKFLSDGQTRTGYTLPHIGTDPANQRFVIDRQGTQIVPIVAVGSYTDPKTGVDKVIFVDFQQWKDFEANKDFMLEFREIEHAMLRHFPGDWRTIVDGYGRYDRRDVLHTMNGFSRVAQSRTKLIPRAQRDFLALYQALPEELRNKIPGPGMHGCPLEKAQ